MHLLRKAITVVAHEKWYQLPEHLNLLPEIEKRFEKKIRSR